MKLKEISSREGFTVMRGTSQIPGIISLWKMPIAEGKTQLVRVVRNGDGKGKGAEKVHVTNRKGKHIPVEPSYIPKELQNPARLAKSASNWEAIKTRKSIRTAG